jgi:hypothetical protein
MSPLLIAIPIAIMGIYLAVSIRILPQLLGRTNIRDQIRTVISLGPGQFLRHTYVSFILVIVGLAVIVTGIAMYSHHLEYDAAPVCESIPRPECRASVTVQVVRVESHNTRSGTNTSVYFTPENGSATFSADDLPGSAIPAGTTAVAEVWRGQVTAVTVNGVRHQSYANQPDSWILIPVGIAALLIGTTWMLMDIALEATEASVGLIRNAFASPVKRRRTLYTFLLLFAVLLVLFGVALVAAGLGATETANVLGAIFLMAGVLVVPTLVLIFVAWLARAYMNVRGLGMASKHSGWFVTAALLVPPLSLYMPYRLVQEVTETTNAPISTRFLKNWWACAIGWLVLIVAGITLGSSDPKDMSISNQLGVLMVFGSIPVGLFGTWLTVQLVRTVDATESAIAGGRHRG